MDHYNEVHVGLRPFICDGKYLYHYSIYITILTFMSVCPYGIRHPGPQNHKMSVIKLALYVLKMKNMHSGPPLDLGFMRRGLVELVI